MGKKLQKKAAKKPHKARRAVKPPRRGAKGPVRGSKQPPKKDRRSEGISELSDLIGIRTVTEDSTGKHKGEVISAKGGLVVIRRDDNSLPAAIGAPHGHRVSISVLRKRLLGPVGN